MSWLGENHLCCVLDSRLSNSQIVWSNKAARSNLLLIFHDTFYTFMYVVTGHLRLSALPASYNNFCAAQPTSVLGSRCLCKCNSTYVSLYICCYDRVMCVVPGLFDGLSVSN